MKKWYIEKASYSISDFISWQKNKTLVLSPDFQRRVVWSPSAKSFLIDTVIRGFPMPVIFLREQKTNLKDLKTIKEVVDGQQRLRTILSYINPGLLSDYNEERDYFEIKSNHNRELAKKKFNELDEDIRRDILEYKFGVHILPSGIEDRDVLQIFSRMNASGVKLNNQEIRNAIYTGPFKTTAYELAFEQVERWKKWKVFNSNNIARMLEVELVSELMIVMLTQGVVGKNQSNIESFYKKYEEVEFNAGKEISRRFRNVMDTIEDFFNTENPQSILTQRTLFFILFILLYDLKFGLGSFRRGEATRPKQISKQTVTKIEELGNNVANESAPKEVITAYQKNTTNIKSRTILFKYFKKEIR